MKHLAKIQSEFIKEARKWDELSHEEQREYLYKHRKSRKRLTVVPDFNTWVNSRNFIDLKTNKPASFSELPVEQQEIIKKKYDEYVINTHNEIRGEAKKHFDEKEQKREERHQESQNCKQERKEQKKQDREQNKKLKEQDLAEGIKIKKLSDEEAEAAGHYFGWENLGQMTPWNKKELEPLLKAKDWAKITSKINMYAQENAADVEGEMTADEMYDDFIKEIKHWIKEVKKDYGTRKMWKEEKDKLGVVEGGSEKISEIPEDFKITEYPDFEIEKIKDGYKLNWSFNTSEHYDSHADAIDDAKAWKKGENIANWR